MLKNQSQMHTSCYLLNTENKNTFSSVFFLEIFLWIHLELGFGQPAFNIFFYVSKVQRLPTPYHSPVLFL